MLIIVFILGFIVGVFSPVLPQITYAILDKIDGARATERARQKGRR